MVPLTASRFGVLFFKGEFLPQKLDPKRNIETRYKHFQAHVLFYKVKLCPGWFVYACLTVALN
jgi:hypothetical protein